MLSLVRKDLILQKPTLLMMLPVLFILMTFSSSYMYLGVLFSIAIIMNAFAADEKSTIHLLLNSLPYTRREIVGSKYAGALLFLLLVVLTIYAGNYIFHKEVTEAINILFIVSFVLGALSFMLPFSYTFKSQYLLIGTLVLFAVYMVAANSLIPDLNDRVRSYTAALLALEKEKLYVILIGTASLLYGCSWLLSVRIFEKKVF